MSHFAYVNARGIVEQVIVAEQDVINSGAFGRASSWVQTSYNTHGGQHPEGRPLRKNYAGIGYTYDPVRDAFYPPKPFSSWSLNEDTCLWDAPTPMPQDGKHYTWNENQLAWEEFVAESVEIVIQPIETSTETIVVDSSVETITLSSVEDTISLDLGAGSDTVTGSATPTI